MTISNEMKKRLYLATGVAGVFVVILAAMAPPSAQADSTARALAAAAGQGLACTKTDKPSGGFVLDCDVPGASPSPTASATVSPSSSPSPSPTATTTATGPQTNCLAAPARCGFPDAGSTGVPAGTSLTPMGGTTIRTAGTVIEGRDISGCVTVAAANVTIRNSRVTAGGCNVIRSNSTGLVIENVEVSCNRSQGTGVGGSGYTARRVNVHDCENGFDTAGNTSISDSYVHDLWHGTDGHTDGVQVWSGSAGITITHNTILNQDPNGTSAIIGGDGTTVTVSGNLLSGGGYVLYCAPGSAGFRVTNNRFGRGGYGPLANCSASQLSGNVSDATGRPLP